MKQHFWLTRVTVEADSPLAVGSGQGDGFRDALFVTGPGGLPYLPGTSLAGVLRSSWRHLDQDDNDVFGTVDGGAKLSRISISDGLIHNQGDKPQSLVALTETTHKDPVLAALAAGITRDHVRIGGNGAAAERAKFDDTAVMAGARFTFEVRLDGEGTNPPTEQEVAHLQALLATPLRVGGKTRRGYGKLKPLASSVCRAFDLSKSADRDAWQRLSPDLTLPLNTAGWHPLLADGAKQQYGGPAGHHLNLNLPLRIEDHLLMGGGSWLPKRLKDEIGVTEAKTPWSEDRIVWQGSKATLTGEPVAVLPGTGIKGALRHRTAYHLHRLGGNAQDIESLFGSIRGNEDSKESGTPGKVYIDDVAIAESPWSKAELHNHVSIDRFTGGPMPGQLFSDVTLTLMHFELHVEVVGSVANGTVKQAFVWALRDLAEGRLGLGAGQNAGYGFVRAMDWSKAVAVLRPWLEEQNG
jgi:CRISPR/Cas system CSM-associated protein Csm3 (group 7 of RAMP superfamily)